MDIKSEYAKIREYREIVMPDGRLIRVFTMEEPYVWLTCVFDETREISMRNAHLNHCEAVIEYMKFCELLDPREQTMENVTDPRQKKEGFWSRLLRTIKGETDKEAASAFEMLNRRERGGNGSR